MPNQTHLGPSLSDYSSCTLHVDAQQNVVFPPPRRPRILFFFPKGSHTTTQGRHPGLSLSLLLAGGADKLLPSPSHFFWTQLTSIKLRSILFFMSILQADQGSIISGISKQQSRPDASLWYVFSLMEAKITYHLFSSFTTDVANYLSSPLRTPLSLRF